MSDTRTYPHSADSDAEQAPACVPYAEFAFYAAKVARLTHDLADAQTVANLQRDLHADELGQCVSENNQLAENAAELGKALDVCIAERDQAYRDLDAQTLKANSFRRELHRYMQHAIELKDMLDASVAERDSAFAELDKHRRELTTLRDERPRLLAANVRLFHDNNALRAELDAERNAHNATAAQLHAELADARAELDAMRQAHSVIVGRMAAMGC